MKEVGNISDFTLQELSEFIPLKISSEDLDKEGRLVKAPHVPLGHQIIAKVDCGDMDEAKFFLCNDISEMQKLHSSYQHSSGVALDWYCIKNQA
jgi:hypothetical protein